LQLIETLKVDVVIICSPLIYGAGLKANFASIIKWVNKGVPWPFGAIHNQGYLEA
jgi:hypothetical protein